MPEFPPEAFHYVAVRDPRAEPLLSQLDADYRARYGEIDEMTRFPDSEFSPPFGAFVLLIEGGQAVAGGAFRRYDSRTAELKRIWTHTGHRRRGLARAVVAELEREAGRRGYRRIYLTTGPRQPEARALYLRTGYRPLFDLRADPLTIGPLPFEKALPAAQTASTSADDRNVAGATTTRSP
ncbi:GNAT family N-acetyltransferase [Crossiella cryophila]|uniref:GNAT superfamily N-acetyltransferase n=1 Tax=Crossiella cryophila TaxID=43355 RepID=A0A7W7FYD6_9PSEU|nr:GNAT family N-acetyltransferase [Crossiella cryophila]MBB4681563.1 GNAT superfamily N-acetyltransferase [Crossiella cryophila]